MSQLAGPVALFLSQQDPVAAATSAPTGIPSSSQIAALYLQAAAKQLAGDVKVGDLEQEMIRAQHQYEILEVSFRNRNGPTVRLTLASPNNLPHVNRCRRLGLRLPNAIHAHLFLIRAF